MKNSNTKFDRLTAGADGRRLFEREDLAFHATELISDLMNAKRVTKSELAKKMGKSKAFITQILSGSRNMTLHTFADVMFALESKVSLSVATLTRIGHPPSPIPFTKPKRGPLPSPAKPAREVVTRETRLGRR